MAGRHLLALHPLCPTSRELVRGLAREGLLGRVEIEVLDAPRPTERRFYPWSVPTLLSPRGGRPDSAGRVERSLEER